VIQNESMGDAVKVTVIATGFRPEPPRSEVRANGITPVIRLQPQPEEPSLPEAVPAPPPPFLPEPVVEPEPEPVLVAEAEPMRDLDDLDTPAYLRQGRLLN